MTQAFLESLRTAMGCDDTPPDGTALYRLLAVPTFHAPTCVELVLGAAPIIRCAALPKGAYDLWTASRVGGDTLDDAIVEGMYEALEWTGRIDPRRVARIARTAASLGAPAVDPGDEAARDGALVALDVRDHRRMGLVASIGGTSRSPSLEAWVAFLYGLVESEVDDVLQAHLAAARSYL